jgi:hypothetical protein
MASTLLTPPINQSNPPTEDEILNKTGDESWFEPILPGLTKDLEKELIGLVLEYERESYATWRWLNRDWWEAESFW